MAEAILAKGNRPVDATPTSGSSNLVTSGGVSEALETLRSQIGEGGSGLPEIHIGDDQPIGAEVLWFDTDANEPIMTKNFVVLDESNIYVSDNGNDETGNGTSDAPYASINTALRTVPKNLNGNKVTIHLVTNNGRGILNEVAKISDFFGGEIIIDSNLIDFDISKVEITNCSMVRFVNAFISVNNITISGSTVYIDEVSNLLISSDSIIDVGIELKAASNLISIGSEANVAVLTNCSVAVKAQELSRAYFGYIGSNDINVTITDGIVAESGSSVSVAINDLTAKTLYTTSTGGTVSINSAQPVVANY